MSVERIDKTSALVAVLEAATEVPAAELRDDVVLSDLGLDSVQYWEILIDLEDRIGEDVPTAVLDRIAQIDSSRMTVGDLKSVLATWDLGSDQAVMILGPPG
jgi:acyl carrier protein